MHHIYPMDEKTKQEENAGQMESERKKKHFVLVHGGCHGAWSWYKLTSLLLLAGHTVTALDMAACGVDPRPIDEVQSIYDYFQPLMDFISSLPTHRRVVLVGHSFGGIGLSLAMERFPERISVAVFATAMMPGLQSSPSTMVKEIFTRLDSMMDCRTTFDTVGSDGDGSPSTVVFGPIFLASKLYQRCHFEDLTLGRMLVRPAKSFEEEMRKEIELSKEKYGSVSRVYIVSKEDEMMKEELQRWMIENNPPRLVVEIHGSDHMLMLSKPQQLCLCLLDIAHRYE